MQLSRARRLSSALWALEPEETLTKAFKRLGWGPKLPASPLLSEDSRLLDYRHPAEFRMLVLAFAAIATLTGPAVWFRDKDTLLAGAAVYLSMLLTSTQSVIYNRLQGAEVTATQFPAIYQMVEELRARFR